MTKKSPPKCVYYPLLYTRAKLLANLIQPYISPQSSVLDIGCGNMLIAKVLRNKIKIQVRGIDVLNMNLTDLPHQVFDGKEIPAPDDNFDFSLLVGVLHHVRDQQALLAETQRVTKRRIIVFEDTYFSNAERLWLKIRDVIGNVPEEMKMNFALNFHTTEGWERIFSEHELRVVRKEVFINLLRLTHHVLYILEKTEKEGAYDLGGFEAGHKLVEDGEELIIGVVGG